MTDTCPSRLTLTCVPSVEADTRGIVETRVGEAVVNDKLGRRHTAAEVTHGHGIIQDAFTRADVCRSRLMCTHSARTEETRGATALWLEVAPRARETRL